MFATNQLIRFPTRRPPVSCGQTGKLEKNSRPSSAFSGAPANIHSLASLSSLREPLQSPRPAVLPVIRIGAIDSITCTWMPHLIEALRDRLPTLK